MAKNNNLFLLVILGFVFIFGLYSILDKKSDPYKHIPEKISESKKIKRKELPDVEFIGGSRCNNESEGDDFELLDIASNEPALQLQMGMGPGLYGSGRHTSEMVGN